MIDRYRDLQEIFAIKNLPTEDVERLIWWAKGSRVGYQGAGYDEVPVEFVAEYVDGIHFGRQLAQIGGK